MQVKNLPERIEQLQNQIILNQEKISNMTRIVNVVQESESSHESDIREIKSALKQMGVKSEFVKERKVTSNNNVLLNRVDESLQEMEKKLVKMIVERLPQHSEAKPSNSRSRSNSKSTDRGIKKKRKKSINAESDSDTFRKITHKTSEPHIEPEINNLLNEKLSIADFQNYIESERNKTAAEIEKIFKTAKNSEKTASRLAEDVFEAIDLNNRKFNDYEERIEQLKSWVEKISKSDDLGKGNKEYANNPSVVLKSELMEFERKLNKKILESLDETNDIMKKIKKQYKGLSNKVKDLEICFYESNKLLEKDKSKKKLISNRSHSILNNDTSNRSLSCKDNTVKRDSRQQFVSTDRAIKNQLPEFDVTKKYKHNSIVPNSESIKSEVFEKQEKELADTYKDNKKLVGATANENSKEFTDFMTFEDQNSSDIFELSENDKTIDRNKSRSKNRSQEKSNSKIKDNSNPNVIKARTRVQEFETLRKQGNRKAPRNLKSQSGSKSSKKSRNGSKKKIVKMSSRKSKNNSLHSNFSSKIKEAKPKDRKLSKKGSNHNSSLKLAKLEKMYEQLSELESKV